MRTYTEKDLDQLSFHDTLLRGFLLRSDFEQSDLVLDIDFIDKWITIESGYEWFVAAADLTFHGVTGFKFATNWHDETYQLTMSSDWILDMHRSLVEPQLVHFDREYWRWQFNFALDTQLSFGSYGFTLALRQDPVRCSEQSLPLDQRK